MTAHRSPAGRLSVDNKLSVDNNGGNEVVFTETHPNRTEDVMAKKRAARDKSSTPPIESLEQKFATLLANGRSPQEAKKEMEEDRFRQAPESVKRKLEPWLAKGMSIGEASEEANKEVIRIIEARRSEIDLSDLPLVLHRELHLRVLKGANHANLADLSGIPAPTIHRFAKGERSLTLKTAAKLAKTLNLILVPRDWIDESKRNTSI